MKKFLQVFYVFFSSIITALAIQNEFLPFGSPFLGLFALVPLYLALAQSSSFREAGFLISAQLFIVHILSSFWLGFFKDFAIFTLGATAAVYIVWGYYLGQMFFAPFYFTKKTALEEVAGLRVWNSPLRVLLFAALWTLYEWYKSNGFLAYPWGTLIMTAWKWNLITQIVSISGTWGISFLFSLFNAVIAEGLFLLFQTARQKCSSYANTAFFCLCLFCCSLAYGSYEYTKERKPIKTIDTLLVQANIDSWKNDNDMAALVQSQALTQDALNASTKKPDLALWSESVLLYAYPDAARYYEVYPIGNSLDKFIAQSGIPFIIGGPVEINQKKNETSNKRDFNNSALYFDKAGNWKSFYGKVQLVPFAERIPYDDIAWVQNFMQTIAGFSSGWAPGQYYTLFDVPLKDGSSAKISTPICFEDAFPYVCRELFFAGSEAFFNITNDAWSLTNSAELQHFVIASYRAQEFRTTLVRGTNAGFTVVTDPAGRILYSMPLFESSADIYSVPIFEREISLYARLGDWLPLALFLAYTAVYLVLTKRLFNVNLCRIKKVDN